MAHPPLLVFVYPYIALNCIYTLLYSFGYLRAAVTAMCNYVNFSFVWQARYYSLTWYLAVNYSMRVK